jgi:hypothetical protein
MTYYVVTVVDTYYDDVDGVETKIFTDADIAEDEATNLRASGKYNVFVTVVNDIDVKQQFYTSYSCMYNLITNEIFNEQKVISQTDQINASTPILVREDGVLPNECIVIFARTTEGLKTKLQTKLDELHKVTGGYKCIADIAYRSISVGCQLIANTHINDGIWITSYMGRKYTIDFNNKSIIEEYDSTVLKEEYKAQGYTMIPSGCPEMTETTHICNRLV